jgi:predicted glycoside hydrolase/deacetylase ChbG (UPF0249 family)
MPQKELIINADDFGLSPEIDRGVAEACSKGIVTSASLLANGPDFDGAVQLARAGSLSVGVHLTLTGGAPVSAPGAIPSLLGAGQAFYPRFSSFFARFAAGLVNKRHVLLEWRAQIEKVVAAGIKPAHLDGEQYVHLVPGLFGLCVRLADEFGIRRVRAPRRILFLSPRPGPERLAARALLEGFMLHPAYRRLGRAASPGCLLGFEASGRLDDKRLECILKNLPEGLSELVCHPGAADRGTPGLPRWGYDWRGELKALTSPRAAALLRASGAVTRH